MIASRFVRLTRLDRLDRRAGVSDRAVALAFSARFFDEVLSGAWTVLAPTFRRAFGLSLVQVGLLTQVLEWVALVVEPPAAALIDLRSRRVLLSVGAVAVGISMLVMGAAHTYAVLLLGFGVYGLGSGPLAHTADVVVVEAFAGDAERAYSRATFLDTVGAMVGPACIAGAVWAGVSWRWVVAALGVAAVVYGWAIAATAFPQPPGVRAEPSPGSAAASSVLRSIVRNVRLVVADAEARRWLLFLFWFDVFEAAFVLKYVWLHETVGISQGGVALWAAAEQVVDLVALVVLDRWLQRHSADAVLAVAVATLVVLPVLWVVAPGIAGRVVVGVPLAFARTMLWPIAKSRSLVAVPELAGAASAVTTLFPIVPLALVVSRVAESTGVGAAMAGTAAAGAVAMLVTVRPGRDRP
ncbi:MAG TPA: MFS transporter [Acidimicrobiales bacterium]